MPDQDFAYKRVLAEFPAHLEKPSSRYTKDEMFLDAKVMYKALKEMEQRIEHLEREKEMLENINDKLERNLRIFAPGNKTIGDV